MPYMIAVAADQIAVASGELERVVCRLRVISGIVDSAGAE